MSILPTSSDKGYQPTARQSSNRPGRKCKFFLAPDGCKKGNKCPFRHTYEFGLTAYKVKVCDFFNTPRGCKYGDKCQFIHPGETAKARMIRPGRSDSHYHWRKTESAAAPVVRSNSPPSLPNPDETKANDDHGWTPERWEEFYPLSKEIADMEAYATGKKPWPENIKKM